MKSNIRLLILLTLTFLISSCDPGCFIFVRNFQQEPVKVKVLYFSDELLSKKQYWLKMRDSICYKNEIDKEFNFSKGMQCKGHLKVMGIDSNSYYTYLPKKSTMLIHPVFMGCVSRFIISDSTRNDTIVFWGKNENYKDYIKEGQLEKRGFILFGTTYLMNVK